MLERMATFHLFNSFPPEIQSLIVASCPLNDRTCLRLTWYVPHNPHQPPLTTLSKTLYSISPSLKMPVALNNDDMDGPSHYHSYCFGGGSELHQRLKSWTPKGLKYCGTCVLFTRRKPSHKGRCKFSLALDDLSP